MNASRRLLSQISRKSHGKLPECLRKKPSHFSAQSIACQRWLSTAPLPACDVDDDLKGPVGDLFRFPQVDESIIGKTASIRRAFGPQSNAEAMITCGGEELAAHASFDPNYGRARDWIRSHPVGPAVLSPVLISGLVGALVEAAFPKSVPLQSSLQLLRPLIVGVEVRAKIEVVAVYKGQREGDENEFRQRTNGYQVDLETVVLRLNDEMIVAQGTHSIWIPDYLNF